MAAWRKHIRSKVDFDAAARWRALALLDAGRPEEARAAVAHDQALASDNLLTCATLRACAASALNDRVEFQNQLRLALAMPLVKVEHLKVQELTALFERLWKAAAILPDDDALRSNLIDRMLAAGLAPDVFFESFRAHEEAVNGVRLYRCVVHQPLDNDWPLFQGCLPGQETWDNYSADWSVLACDEEEAAQLVLNWQSQCYPLDPMLVACRAESGEYQEPVGVVQQGPRWHGQGSAGAAPIQPD